MNNVLNIPFTNNFLDRIVEHLINDSKKSKLLFSDYTILINNINLFKPIHSSFFKVHNNNVLLMPNIISLSNLKNYLDYYILKYPTLHSSYKHKLKGNVVSSTQRSFILCKLIERLNKNLPLSSSLKMADHLGELIDKANYEEIELTNLDKIVDSSLAEHWNKNTDFLNIAANAWPEFLLQNNLMDYSQQQNILYEFFNLILQQDSSINNTENKFIAVNLISTNKKVMRIINTLAKLDNAALIYYGIDANLYKKAQEKGIDYTHPQAVLQHTLLNADIKLNNIVNLHEDKNTFIDVLWNSGLGGSFAANELVKLANNISVLNTNDTSEEARTVALIVRKHIENFPSSIAILANDFSLINKIKQELSKYDIAVDNKLGESLLKQPQTEFLFLTFEAVTNNFNALYLLALLKHSSFRGVKLDIDLNNTVLFLDKYVVRGSLVGLGLQEYIDICNEHITQNKHIAEAKQALKLLSYLRDTYDEFLQYLKNYKLYSFNKLLNFNIQISEELSLDTNQEHVIWQNNVGAELLTAITGLQESSKESNFVNLNVSYLADYISILNNYISKESVYKINSNKNTVVLYGKFQANLTNHSLVIMCGLNNTIPNNGTISPWLSKNMLKELGFVDPNYETALQSYLFCQVLSNNKVVLSYSNKNNNGDAVFASKWIMQLENFFKAQISKLDEDSTKDAINLHSYNDLKTISRTITYTTNIQLAKHNYQEVTILSDLLPTAIPATSLELLNNNPYAFFVSKILKIAPLDNIELKLDEPRILGSVMHNVLEEFFSNKDNLLSSNNQQINVIYSLAYKKFKNFLTNNMFVLFNWSKILHQLKSVLEDTNHNSSNEQVYVEQKGSYYITVNGHKLSITARADRIDINIASKTATIIDYKTSSNTKFKKWFMQLPTIGFILYNGGFKDVIFSTLDNINAQYLFLPTKYGDKIAKISLEDAFHDDTDFNALNYISNYDNEISNLLSRYYNGNNVTFAYNRLSKDISEEHRYFNRYIEWANSEEDIINNIPDDEEQDENE